ncbi:Disease resistance protein RPM1 [Linum grandiflorum]
MDISTTVTPNGPQLRWLAWVDLLLRDLIKKINKTTRSEAKIEAEGLSGIKYRELAEKLKGYLEDKTYLVVLDDVWTSDVWSRMKIALPDGKNKSRVILTARTRDNISEASLEPGSYVYEVQPLDVTEAMELFCSRAFSSSRNSAACPRNLRGTADTILEKCKGLPIAIDSIGRLLAKKEPSLKAWTTTLDDLQFELSKNKLPLNSVLLLSYNDLPYRLKRCFLYFALFPEDHKIWCGKLVNLWMAEGFLEPGENNGGSTPEDVGMRYIRELIGRNVLQAVRWDLYGDHGMCRMHDLYRDIALQISDKENFCSLYTLGTSFPTQDSISNHGRRRVSIHGESNESDVIISPEASNQTEAGADMEGDFWNRSSWKEVIIPPDATDVIKLVKGMKHLRSLLLFVKGNPFSLTELGWADHRLLRVLDMENAPVFALSKDIDVLYNLKFLSLSHTKIKSLANTIENLASLETLDVTSTDVKSLPSEIIKLENLRHLLAGNLRFGRLLTYDGLKGVKVPSGTDISSLKKLQALRLVEANEEIVQQLRKMTQLVQLGITNVGQAQMVDLCSALKKMLLLRWLVVIASTEHEILQMDSLGESSSSAPPLQRLEYLILCGQLNNIPNWIHSLPSLTTIRLVWSRLPVEIDPAMHLQGMDRLKNLWLQNAYVGSELKFLSGFKSLRALAFGNLPNLETLTIGEEGVMPNLRIMTVRDCPNLKNISPGIQFLSKLKELTLENVPNELVERIRGRDHANFQHIHIIWCRYKSTDNRLTTEIL